MSWMTPMEPAMGLRRYMKSPRTEVSIAVRRNLNRAEVPSRHSDASRRRADRGVLLVGGHGTPRIDRTGPEESRGDRGRPRRDRGAGRRSPTFARPIPRGVPLHRVADPTTEDAGGTPGEDPEAADIPRGGARVQ